MSIEEQIIRTTEVRRHNGQNPYGPWIALGDSDAPKPVQIQVVEEIAERMFSDMRREDQDGSNTDESGTVTVGGRPWLYRR